MNQSAWQWLEASQQRLPHVLAFLQDLVRIPSVNGRQSESAVALRVALEAEKLGLSVRLPALDPDRQNVLVEWGSGKTGFVLVGHLDTVSEGATEAWVHAPFSAILDQGNLYGRGTADNKAGIAIGLYTIAMLRDMQVLEPGLVRLMLAGVVDEESGASSKLGMRYLLNEGLLQPAVGAIYTYASDIVCVGHRGLLRVILHAAGQSVHSGSPQWNRGEDGVNAVTGLADVLLRMERLRLHATRHPAFRGLSCKVTPGTVFKGGEFESMVPAAAEALVDVRLMPNQPAEDVLGAFETIIHGVEAARPGLKITMDVKNNLPGVALPVTHPLVQSAQYWTKVVTGKKWPAVGAGPANEGYMLIQAGIPTLCGFGPTGGNAHAPDEWVNVDSLASSMAMYAGIITDLFP